ncbi:hypothetical protein BGZ65_008104, partial [Modicella reniformis]
TVAGIYNEILPNTDLFDEEVKSFGSDWKGLQERLFFLRLAADLAGDNVDHYHEITENIFSEETRQSFCDKLIEDEAYKGNHRELVNVYKDKCNRMENYTPPTREEYEARFADYTNLQYDRMLDAIFERAGATAQQDTTSAPEPAQYGRCFGFCEVEMPMTQSRADDSADEVEYDRNYSFIF